MVGGTFLVFIIAFVVCAGTLGALFITGAELRILGRPGEARPRAQPSMTTEAAGAASANADADDAPADEDEIGRAHV